MHFIGKSAKADAVMEFDIVQNIKLLFICNAEV